ncbi:MAG: hypothetical protein ACK4OM_01430 [Alphaproteobacteria bacterium]
MVKKSNSKITNNFSYFMEGFITKINEAREKNEEVSLDDMLVFISYNGIDKDLHKLLNHKKDFSFNMFIRATALILASAQGHDKIVESLLNHKKTKNYGICALSWALLEAWYFEHKEIQNMLLPKWKESVANISSIISLPIILVSAHPIKELVSSSKACNGLVKLLQPLFKTINSKLDNFIINIDSLDKPIANLRPVINKLLDKLPMKAETRIVTQDVIKSSVPVILGLATVKASWTIYKDIRDHKGYRATIKDAGYEFSKTIAEGAVVTASIAAGAAVIGGTIAPFIAGCTALYGAKKFVEVVGPHTKNLANRITTGLGRQ